MKALMTTMEEAVDKLMELDLTDEAANLLELDE